jgi:hypothetical protein
LIEESAIGAPVDLQMNDQRISQDIARSYTDFYQMKLAMSRIFDQPGIFMELGSGYGCLSEIILKKSNLKAWLVDIPPALYIAQWYMLKKFPDKRIFTFRVFDKFEEIQEELLLADIAFFTPNQLEKIPDSMIDIFANVNSFQEMELEQVANYLEHADRLSKEYIYLRNSDGFNQVYYNSELGKWYIATKQSELTVYVQTLSGKKWANMPRSAYELPSSWKLIDEYRFELDLGQHVLLYEKK